MGDRGDVLLDLPILVSDIASSSACSASNFFLSFSISADVGLSKALSTETINSFWAFLYFVLN